MDPGRRLGRILIDRVLVPYIHAGHMDYDEATVLLRHGVVSSLHKTGKTKALIAAHMSKSTRWVHTQLKEMRTKAADPDSQSSSTNSGYQMLLNVVEALGFAHPKVSTLADIRRDISLEQWEMSDVGLEARLDLYESLGLIERVDVDGYLLKSELLVELPGEDRLEKMAERISWIPALAMSNFRGEGEFGGMVAKLIPEAFERARERLRNAFAEIMAEALKETHQTNDSNLITVRAVIAMGAVGESDANR